jgi:hypothetical protein
MKQTRKVAYIFEIKEADKCFQNFNVIGFRDIVSQQAFVKPRTSFQEQSQTFSF